MSKTILSFNNPSPQWVTWLFRIEFLITKGLSVWIASTALISAAAKVEILLALSTIDLVVWGFARMMGVKKPDDSIFEVPKPPIRRTMKKIAFFQQDLADTVVSINGDTTYAGQPISTLPQLSEDYTIELDEADEYEDLCIAVDDNVDPANFICVFNNATNGQYNAPGQAILGPRPPHR